MNTVGFRYFLLSSSDQLYAVSQHHFNQILAPRPQVTLSMFANQRIRTAKLVMAMRQNEPQGVILSTYSYIHFNADGLADYNVYAKDERDYVNSTMNATVDHITPPSALSNRGSNVVDISSHLAKKRARWQPELPLESLIWSCAMGQKKCKQLEFEHLLVQ